VQQSTKGQFIWVITEQKKAEFRPVTVGDWQGKSWFITEGLKSGELIAVDGVVGLHPGDRVEIKEMINEQISEEDLPEIKP
jgi:membrane fusion protein, multidrug efflux system